MKRNLFGFILFVLILTFTTVVIHSLLVPPADVLDTNNLVQTLPQETSVDDYHSANRICNVQQAIINLRTKKFDVQLQCPNHSSFGNQLAIGLRAFSEFERSYYSREIDTEKLEKELEKTNSYYPCGLQPCPSISVIKSVTFDKDGAAKISTSIDWLNYDLKSRKKEVNIYLMAEIASPSEVKSGLWGEGLIPFGRGFATINKNWLTPVLISERYNRTKVR